MSSFEDRIAGETDHYFRRTKEIVRRFGDCPVTYAIFMRRPVVVCLQLAVAWLEVASRERGAAFDIERRHAEGARVGAGEPLLYVTGPFAHLVDLETTCLQRVGAPCVAAYNAYQMCVDMPRTAFLAMDARHCAGAEMAEMMACAARVGSEAARRTADAVGFVGTSTAATARHFGLASGMGTMPHALVGYAGSTLRGAEMFHEAFPDEPLTVLVDYYAQEVADSLAVAARYPDLAAAGRLAVRIDTHGGRFVEGLDTASSYAVLERHAPEAIRTYRTETELRWLVGTGVSAAALFHLRDALDAAGHGAVKIVASSGFGPAKCRLMGEVRAPIDTIGTGSYLPERWSETYAAADVIAYGERSSVKIGREFLLRDHPAPGGG